MGLAKKAGLIKAVSRVADAENSFSAFLEAKTLKEFLEHWSEFLTAGAAVFNILEASVRHTPQGRQWYGGVRTAGKKDPLVLYMRQARNEEEHGFEPVIEPEAETVVLHVPDGGAFVTLEHIPAMPDEPWKVLLRPEAWKGEQPPITLTRPSRKLVTVVSKEGDVFDPPKEHLGQPLTTGDAEEVGRLYLKYIRSLVEVAESL